MTQIDENALEAAIEQLFDNSEEDTWRCRGRKMITAYLEALPPTGDAMELVAVIGKHLKGRDVGCTSDELHCRAADALTAAAARIAELEREPHDVKSNADHEKLKAVVAVCQAVDERKAANARAERLEAALRDAREAWSRYEKFLELIGTATDIERAYNDVCTALSPAAPSKGGDGWQDIASAPRDGTPIQIWQEGLEPNQYVAAFDEGWSNSGWWLICDGKNTEIPLRGSAPTYWRHVFDAPTPHKEGK